MWLLKMFVVREQSVSEYGYYSFGGFECWQEWLQWYITYRIFACCLACFFSVRLFSVERHDSTKHITYCHFALYFQVVLLVPMSRLYWTHHILRFDFAFWFVRRPLNLQCHDYTECIIFLPVGYASDFMNSLFASNVTGIFTRRQGSDNHQMFFCRLARNMGKLHCSSPLSQQKFPCGLPRNIKSVFCSLPRNEGIILVSIRKLAGVFFPRDTKQEVVLTSTLTSTTSSLYRETKRDTIVPLKPAVWERKTQNPPPYPPCIFRSGEAAAPSPA